MIDRLVKPAVASIVASSLILGAVLGMRATEATAAPASAPAPCRWGEPGWGAWNDQWGSTTAITVSCNGGITPCSGRLDVTYWTWDVADGEWAPYSVSGWYSDTAVKNCGETYPKTVWSPVTMWPPSTRCCVTLELRVFDGSRYNLARWYDNIFETP